MTLDQAHAADLVNALSDLVRAARTVGQRHRSELGAAGTPLGILKLLRRSDLRPGDLAAGLHVGPSVISRALAPLERQGLVLRVSDPADARAALISLTEHGRTQLDRLQDEYVERVRTALSEWTDGEAENAVAVLERLESTVLTVEAHSSTPPELHRRLLADAELPMIPILQESRS